MNRKQYVIDILKKLEPHLSMVTWIIAMIELWNCTNEDIDSIIKIIESQIKNIKDKNLKNRLKKIQDILLIIKDKETISRIEEEKEINNLLKEIENI